MKYPYISLTRKAERGVFYFHFTYFINLVTKFRTYKRLRVFGEDEDGNIKGLERYFKKFLKTNKVVKIVARHDDLNYLEKLYDKSLRR